MSTDAIDWKQIGEMSPLHGLLTREHCQVDVLLSGLKLPNISYYQPQKASMGWTVIVPI